MIQHALSHFLGLDNLSGPFYGFWSGIGLSVFMPLVYCWHNTCHEPKCLRPGRHPHKHFKFCKKHHPLMRSK